MYLISLYEIRIIKSINKILKNILSMLVIMYVGTVKITMSSEHKVPLHTAYLSLAHAGRLYLGLARFIIN